jgi:hypothetical protein
MIETTCKLTITVAAGGSAPVRRLPGGCSAYRGGMHANVRQLPPLMDRYRVRGNAVQFVCEATPRLREGFLVYPSNMRHDCKGRPPGKTVNLKSLGAGRKLLSCVLMRNGLLPV